MRYSDYLVHYNHNHDRLGRFARSTGAAASSVGGRVTRKKKKAAPKSNVKNGKSANTKLSDADRNRIVKSGTAKEVAKYKDRLSTRELETAVNRLQQEKVKRIDLDKQLSELSGETKNKASVLEKVEKYSSDLERISSSVEKAAKMYNTAAKVHNAMSSSNDQWPIYGEKKQYKTPSDLKEIIRSGDARAIKANKGRMNEQEHKEATQRLQRDMQIDKYVREQAGEISKKDRILRTGSARDVYNNRDKFTQKEYEDAVKRFGSDEEMMKILEKKKKK